MHAVVVLRALASLSALFTYQYFFLPERDQSGLT